MRAGLRIRKRSLNCGKSETKARTWKAAVSIEDKSRVHSRPDQGVIAKRQIKIQSGSPSHREKIDRPVEVSREQIITTAAGAIARLKPRRVMVVGRVGLNWQHVPAGANIGGRARVAKPLNAVLHHAPLETVMGTVTASASALYSWWCNHGEVKSYLGAGRNVIC